MPGAIPTTDEIWQALLRHAGQPRPKHFDLDASVLSPLRAILRRLGDPQRDLSIVHIAGSKGKGSTALYLERLLLRNGYRVATFTSPHLQHWRERFRVGGAPVDERELVGAALRVERALAARGNTSDARFFDLLTAIALVLFADYRPDWVVLETGIGGRFDATNVVHPALCILTRIEREHCDVLGESLAEIAAHKAGIIKPGCRAICAAMPPAALAEITREARRVGASLLHAGQDFEFRSTPVGMALQRVGFRGRGTRTFELAAATPAAAENAALALAALETLHPGELAADTHAAFSLPLPARCELLRGAPDLVIDAAHTPASFDALAEALQGMPHRRVHAVVACSSSRHTRELAQRLGEFVQRIVTTVADPVYTVSPAALADEFRLTRPTLDVVVRETLPAALAEATRGLGAGDLVCILGSTYLAGRARALLVESTANAAGCNRQDRLNPCALT